MNDSRILWHSKIDRDLINTLGELVEKYNRYLEETQGEDQLDIHGELQKIIDKLKMLIPECTQ